MQERSLYDLTFGRSVPGTIGGLAAIILTILGLAHVLPLFLAAIATIAIGVALLFKGIAISAEYPKLLAQLSPGTYQSLELTSGVSAELLSATTGIILGLLALLNIAPEPLIAVAIITYGCGLVMGSGILTRLHALKISISGYEEKTQRIADEMISTATGAQLLVGIAAIVLGILSLIGIASFTLDLVALLVIGAISVISSSSIASKMISMLP